MRTYGLHSLVFITKIIYPLVYGRYTTIPITAHDKAFSEILSSK